MYMENAHFKSHLTLNVMKSRLNQLMNVNYRDIDLSLSQFQFLRMLTIEAEK